MSIKGNIVSFPGGEEETQSGGQDTTLIDESELLDIQQEMLKTIEYVDEYAWLKGKLGGLDWGFPSFNRAFDGLQPGLILVAGQPNIGNIAVLS